jgi:type III restriction enzyme
VEGSGGTSPTPGTIDNPVINSPFAEPTRHFRVVDGQVTGAIEDGRRPSEFFVPVPRPRKASPQLALQFGGGVRQQPNEIVNEIRFQVAKWRAQDYPHATGITKELLAHWRAEDRERRLFFCQVEAVETAIYLTEAAEKMGDTKSLNVIRGENERLNDRLPRMAFKMATGSGKTVVMGMLIAWQALNKLANPYDKRFSTRFLVITPGITIKDRLRVLLPNDPQTFYRSMDLVTPEQLDRLLAATIEITNYHALIRREKLEAASLTKKVLAGPDGDKGDEFDWRRERLSAQLRALAEQADLLYDEFLRISRRVPLSRSKQTDDLQDAVLALKSWIEDGLVPTEHRPESAVRFAQSAVALSGSTGVRVGRILAETRRWLEKNGHPMSATTFQVVLGVVAGMVSDWTRVREFRCLVTEDLENVIPGVRSVPDSLRIEMP